MPCSRKPRRSLQSQPRTRGEYVIDWGPGYRIYLAKDGNSLIVLFGGGTKRRQQADIDRAVALHTEYKSRKAPKAAANKAEKRKR